MMEWDVFISCREDRLHLGVVDLVRSKVCCVERPATDMDAKWYNAHHLVLIIDEPLRIQPAWQLMGSTHNRSIPVLILDP